MSGGKGKRKGGAYERAVCKALSLWVSGGQREDLFWRSAMSGGRATVGRKSGKSHDQHAGDITSTHPDGHVLTDRWYVECKAYSDLAIVSALTKGVGVLSKFWRTACQEATHYQKMPMLIAKQDNWPPIVLVPTAHLLSPYGTAPYPKAHFGRFALLRADVLSFEGMCKLPFEGKPKGPQHTFLMPGELERILGPQYKKQKIKRERLGERIRL